MPQEMRCAGGVWLPASDVGFGNLLAQTGGLFDKETIDAALAHVTDFSLALDIGAHIGTWTRQLAGRFGNVLAFEPDREMFGYLTRNTEDIGNVRALALALGRSGGRVGFRREPQHHNSMGYVVPDGPRPGDDWAIMIALDALALADGVGLVKIDVEGSECDVIAGARGTILASRPVVVIEQNWCSDRYRRGRTEAVDLLKQMGMREVERVEFQPDNFNVILTWEQ